MLNFESYENRGEEETKENICVSKIKNNISFSYDGGRLSISIDGEEVYKNMGAGIDFSVTINN